VDQFSSPSPVKDAEKKYDKPSMIGKGVSEDELSTFNPQLQAKIIELQQSKK